MTAPPNPSASGQPAFAPSDELRVIARPFAAYRQLVAQRPSVDGARLLLRRPLLWLLIAASFISISTAGRFVWYHLVFAPLVWGVVVAIQAGLIAAAARVGRPKVSVARLIDLYFIGQAPWLLLLLTGAGVCLLSPRVFETYIWLSRAGIVGLLVAIAGIWSALVATGFFAAAFDLTRRRALLATLLFYSLYTAAVLATHLLLDQLQPLIWT